MMHSPMFRHSFFLLCAVSLFWSGTQFGCRPQVRDDDDWMQIAEQRASQKEKDLQQAAMSSIGGGKSKREAMLWKQLLTYFPKGYYAGLAHMRLGRIAYQKKDWKRACRHFKASKRHTLSSQERIHILMKYAYALQKLKRHAAIHTLLHKRYMTLPSTLQRRALHLLITAATAQKKHALAFKWRMRLLTQGRGSHQAVLRRQLVAYVHTLPISRLKQFIEHASQRLKTFPLDHMALRLGRLYYQNNKYKLSKQWLHKLTQQIGIAHPLYARARRLLAEVAEVKRPADPLTIGVIYPISGPGVTIGQWMRNGIDLAISGYSHIKLVFRDSGVTPGQSAKAVEELVRRYKAIAILGPPLSTQAVEAAKRAEQWGVPFITIAPKEDFTKLGKFIFRNNFTLSAMGRSVARYAFNQLRIKRFGVLYSATRYGRTQAKAFVEELRKIGGLMTSAIEYDPTTQDFQMYVKLLLGTTYANGGILRLSRKHMRGLHAFEKRRLRKKIAKMLRPLVPFEGLFIPEQASLTSQIAAYLSYFNVGLKRPNLGQTPMFFSPLSRFRKVQLLGNNNWYHKDLFKSGNKYVRGGLFPVRFYPGSFRTESQNFVHMYKRTYSKDPIHISAYAYDAMRLLAHIASSGKVRNRPQFRRALLAIRNFPGPTGPMRTLPNGEIVGPVHFLLAYKGQFRLHGTLK